LGLDTVRVYWDPLLPLTVVGGGVIYTGALTTFNSVSITACGFPPSIKVTKSAGAGPSTVIVYVAAIRDF
jgi:hypothetical protein